jgi:glycosyltransferase involved in cell wall biosynthesis
MPRVLRIINRFNLGGPTYNAAYLTKYLAPEFETLLIGGKNEETEKNSEYIIQDLGIEAITIDAMHRSLNPLNDIPVYQEIKRIIKVFKPDIVHTHAAKAGALGRKAALTMNVPVIIHTFHGHVFDSYFGSVKSAFFQWMERRLAKRTTKIIALSSAQKFDLVEKYRICPADKVEIIPLGFDLARFQLAPERKRKSFRKKYMIDDDEVVISIVGRIVPVKNHKLFVDSINDLLERTGKKIRAFIIGDGEDKEKMMVYAAHLNMDTVDFTVENKRALITFTSWIKDIDEVMAGSDIIALTSLNEGTPVSLIEAQAAGKPVVSTLVGGIENTVIPGETALLSQSDEVVEFSRNLLLMVENEDMRKDFGAKGWPFVRERFHYTRLVTDMAALYRQLLSQK